MGGPRMANRGPPGRKTGQSIVPASCACMPLPGKSVNLFFMASARLCTPGEGGGPRKRGAGVSSGVGGRRAAGDLGSVCRTGLRGGHSPISETHMLRAVPYTLKYSRVSCRTKHSTASNGPVQAWWSCRERRPSAGGGRENAAPLPRGRATR